MNGDSPQGVLLEYRRDDSEGRGPHQEGRKGYRVGEAGQGAKEAHREQEQPHRQLRRGDSDRPGRGIKGAGESLRRGRKSHQETGQGPGKKTRIRKAARRQDQAPQAEGEEMPFERRMKLRHVIMGQAS
mgnify:CR=1 FL=1